MVFVGALNADTVEKVAIVMAGVVVVISVLILRSSLKPLSKLTFIVVLAGVGVGLFQNRVELGHCSQTCSCAIYGQHVEMPRLPFACDY